MNGLTISFCGEVSMESYIRLADEDINVLFIIGSCIEPWTNCFTNGRNKAGCSVEMRLEQTKETISSIREYCSNADVMLVDNGANDYEEEIISLVDQYYYIGSIKKYKKASIHPNKGIGETFMMLYAMERIEKKYDLIFKISGRYKLNENFCLKNWEVTAYNFLNYGIDGQIIEHMEGKYVRGSHSTRLYAFPGEKIRDMRKLLVRGLFRERLLHESIETAMPRGLKKENVRYLKTLGVEGLIGGKTYIQE